MRPSDSQTRGRREAATTRVLPARPIATSSPLPLSPSEHDPGPPIWRNRPFVLLWVAQAISQTAQNAIWYGMMVLVQTRSHSSTQMSLAIMTLIVPSVLFGIVAGAYVDRWDKRAVLIGTNALRAIVTLGYMAFTELLPLVYVTNFLFSTIGQFFAPAEAALIPTIVPRRRLIQANSLFHLTFTASQLVGIVLMGPLVVNLAGVDGLFGLVAVLIGLCAVLVWPLPRGLGAPRQDVDNPLGGGSFAGLWADIREVGGYIQSDRVVRLAVAHWTLGAALGLVIAMLAPAFAESMLGVRPEDSVFVLAPAGVGMFLGTALLSRFGNNLDKHHLIEAGLIIVAAVLMVLAVLRPVADLLTGSGPVGLDAPADPAGSWLVGIVMLAGLIAGLGFVAIIVASQTIIQERVPVAVRGRVFAVQLMLSNVVTILPLVFMGGLADLIGVGRTLVLLAVATLLLALWTVRAHRRLARATESRVPSLESRVPSPEPRVPSPESRVQSPE
jgi:MFS family permease